MEEENKWYKSSANFPYFADFEGQSLYPNEVKQLRPTARVLEAVRDKLIIEVEAPESVESENTESVEVANTGEAESIESKETNTEEAENGGESKESKKRRNAPSNKSKGE